jgi:hypothetical protein
MHMLGQGGGVQVTREAGVLVIERRWLGWRSIGVIIFAVVWFAFLIGFALTPPAPESDPAERLLLVPALGVGLAAGYLALATAVNRTRLTLDAERVTVTHAPLPWSGRRLARASVKRASAERIESGSAGSRRVSYSVVAHLHDGKRTRLVGDLNSSAEGEAIAGAINEGLKAAG